MSTPQTGPSAEAVRSPKPEHVGRLARRGATWTFGFTIANQFLNIATTAILARYLLPSDYGMIGMVATLTGLLAVLSSFGLTLATVQRADLTFAHVHNIFWINSAVGLAFWGVCVAAAPSLALFYGEPELSRVTMVMGASFAIGALASQPKALLQRWMRFRQLTLMELGTQIATSLIAVGLALAGWGYWSLVARAIAGTAITVVLVYWLSGYRPGKYQRSVDILPLMRFGGFVTLSAIVTYFAQNMDNIVVGRVFGTETLGFYTRAYFLMTLPAILFSNSISRVMLPALSALADDLERQANAYRKAQRAIAFAGLPASVGLAISAPEAVRLIYGQGWAPVVPILAWLSVTMAASVLTNSVGWLYMARGRTKVMLFANIFYLATLIPFIIVGSWFGVTGIAAAYAFRTVIFTLPMLYVAHRLCDISFVKTVQVLWPIVAIATLMGALVYSAGWLADSVWNAWLITLAVKIAVGLLSYGAMSMVFLQPIPLPVPDRIQPVLNRIGLSSIGN